MSGRISGEGTGSDGIPFVFALLHGINFIIVIAFTETRVAAVAGTEKTDGGEFK